MSKSLKTDKGIVSFSISKTLWMYAMIIPSVFIDWSAITAQVLIVFSLLILFTIGIGHSIGLHRGVIHKSFKSSKLFRNISIYLFVLTGMGGPLNWLKQHYYRDYWQNRKDCPRYFRYQHSLITDYWWNLHFSFEPTNIDLYNIPQEDLNDGWFKFLNKTWILHNLTLMVIFLLIFGLNATLFLCFFRSALVILGHWYIGYASHKYGYARHEIKDADESGYNDVLLGLISFGEGFHNNHHSYPTSAKFSSRWYEVDFSWMIVWTLQKLGIVSEVKTQTDNLKETAITTKVTIWRFPWS